MNREEFDFTNIKEEEIIPTHHDYLEPMEAHEYEQFSEEDIAKQIPRRFRDQQVLEDGAMDLNLAAQDLQNMGFFESLHFYLELIGKQVNIEGIKVFKAGDDPCSAFVALHRIFTNQDPELAESVRFCHKHGIGKRTLYLLIEGIEPDDYRTLFYGFLILADLTYPTPKNLKNYDQHVQWGQQIKAILVGQPEFAKLTARLLSTSMSMQQSASDKERKKFKKLLEIVIVTVNNILAISQDGILQVDMIYNTQLSTKQKAIEVHQRFVVQLADVNYFDLLSVCMFDFSHGTLSFTGQNSIAITFMETYYYLYQNIDLRHVFKSVKYVDPDDPLQKLELQPKKRAKLPNLIEMMEESSRHPRFLRMPMFKIPQQDGRYIMTNTLDPEKQREERERGFKQRKQTKIPRYNQNANNPSPIKYQGDEYLNCYTQDFYRQLLKIAETLTQSSMFNDLVDISFSELERNDTAVISKFNRYQFFIFITFILRYNRFKHLTQNALKRDELRASLSVDPDYIGRTQKVEEEIERQIPFHLPVNDVKNALHHDILDLAIEAALTESKITKAKERKVYQYHASMAFLLEVFHYIDEVDKVRIEDSEIRVFKEMRERQTRKRNAMLGQMQQLQQENEEQIMDFNHGEENKAQEQREIQELEVVLTPDQIYKLEAYFVSERMKKHLLHRDLLSVARYGLENWKSKDGIQLRRDLIGFVDSLTIIMERYTLNKTFRVITTKKRRNKKRKLSLGLDADDEEQAAILLRIEAEEKARMQAQNPQDEQRDLFQEVLENKLKGFQGEVQEEEQKQLINEKFNKSHSQSSTSQQLNFLQRQTSFKVEFLILITDKVLAQYVDVLKHTTVKHLREQKNLLRQVARFFIMISDTLNKPEVFFQADIIIAFYSLLKNKNFSSVYPGVKEIKRAMEIIVRQFVTVFRKNPLIAVEGLFRYQKHDLQTAALTNYENQYYGNAQEQYKTKEDANLEQQFQAVFSDDEEEHTYSRQVKEAQPATSSDDSDVDGELVFDLAKMNQLWTEAEDLVLRAEFHKLKGNTKQRCFQLQEMLKDVQAEDTLAKSAKDIKMRLNMLNIKREKKKTKRQVKRKPPVYQDYQPQRGINPLDKINEIKDNINRLYALSQRDSQKGQIIEKGLTMIKEHLTICYNLRKATIILNKFKAQLRYPKEVKNEDFCFIFENKEESQCLKIEEFQDLLSSLCILTPQECDEKNTKGKWMLRIPALVGIQEIIQITHKFDEALQCLNDSISQ